MKYQNPGEHAAGGKKKSNSVAIACTYYENSFINLKEYRVHVYPYVQLELDISEAVLLPGYAFTDAWLSIQQFSAIARYAALNPGIGATNPNTINISEALCKSCADASGGVSARIPIITVNK